MSLHILLIEDSPGDIRLTREAFRDSGSPINLHVVVDGVEAMAFLKREGAHTLAPRPDIILLDLSLPKIDGREVLARIKADDELKSIPTVVLSNSTVGVDVMMSYKLQANCYLAKPARLEEFLSVVKNIGDFWLTKAVLPQHDLPDQAADLDASGRT